MPVIKVKDIAYARLQAPELDTMEEFLTDFGLVRSERTRTALYMRGNDAPHHLHVTELGEPRLLSIAYEAGSEDDLKRLSSVPGHRRSRRSTSLAAVSAYASSNRMAIELRSCTASRRSHQFRSRNRS